MEREVVVARFNYRHEAELARGYLEDAGIASVLAADDAAGIEAGLTFSNPAELKVEAARAEEARRVLRDAGVLDEGESGGDG